MASGNKGKADGLRKMAKTARASDEQEKNTDLGIL
jgi:hypothetical protein